ncbi:hypothetical protein K1719_012034 [Acacia pycnantha]|nr:hypothetical protein K1719_012034 [Acacia pycnantha]
MCRNHSLYLQPSPLSSKIQSSNRFSCAPYSHRQTRAQKVDRRENGRVKLISPPPYKKWRRISRYRGRDNDEIRACCCGSETPYAWRGLCSCAEEIKRHIQRMKDLNWPV